MTTLQIDSVVCPIDDAQHVALEFRADDLAEPASGRSGQHLTLEVRSTPQTDRLFGYARSLYTAETFNTELHTGLLKADSTTVFRGVVYLREIIADGTTVRYRVELAGGAHQWVKNAVARPFDAIGVNYAGRLDMASFAAGWQDDAPVKFLPVIRSGDSFRNPASSIFLMAPEHILSIDDYHPFLSANAMVRAIFSEAGYTVKSRFMEGELFRSLYVSGAYTARDTRSQRSRMGFLARRKDRIMALADESGRVDADPFATHNTVGNIVNAFTPMMTDDQNRVLDDVYASNGCLSFEEGEICYRPPSDVQVGFEYRIRYTTEHRILSRTQLQGIDGVWLGAGCDVRFTLANRYRDRRTEPLATGSAYRAIVFEHDEGAAYSLRCTTPEIPDYTLVNFAARSVQVNTPGSVRTSRPRLYRKAPGDSEYRLYDGDWALYDGYVEETGYTEVELTVRTPPEQITPTAPKLFHEIYFHGAAPGMRFTLDRQTSLRPIFSAAPGYGSLVKFEDLAKHDVRQIVLIEALQHMFNLRIFTDETAKEVWIEPHDDFYDRTEIQDWSDRIDTGKEIRFADTAQEIRQTRTWAYRETDTESAQGPVFGRWSFRSPSRAAREGNDVRINALFTTARNVEGEYPDAESARILQIENTATDDPENVNFTPRIVRYVGLKALPEGERWGYPLSSAVYPFAAFHYEGDDATGGFTLCFEDRDGLDGLHRFYDRQLDYEAKRHRIRLHMRLAPHDYAALFDPRPGHASIRSCFRLTVNGETSVYTLHAIEGYDPHAESTPCIFTRLLKD